MVLCWKGPVLHCSGAFGNRRRAAAVATFAAAWILAGATRQLTATANEQLPPAPPGSPVLPSTSFTIFIRGVSVGSEQVALTRTADGWTIVSSGRMGPPVELVSRRVEARYTADWKPVELVIDASIRGVARSLHTTIAGTTATNEV